MSELGSGHNFSVAWSSSNPVCLRCGCSMFTLLGDEIRERAKAPCEGRKPLRSPQETASE